MKSEISHLAHSEHHQRTSDHEGIFPGEGSWSFRFRQPKSFAIKKLSRMNTRASITRGRREAVPAAPTPPVH